MPEIADARIVIAKDDGLGVVRRAIVPDDELEIAERLAEYAGDGLTDVVLVIVGAEHHRY